MIIMLLHHLHLNSYKLNLEYGIFGKMLHHQLIKYKLKWQLKIYIILCHLLLQLHYN